MSAQIKKINSIKDSIADALEVIEYDVADVLTSRDKGVKKDSSFRLFSDMVAGSEDWVVLNLDDEEFLSFNFKRNDVEAIYFTNDEIRSCELFKSFRASDITPGDILSMF